MVDVHDTEQALGRGDARRVAIQRAAIEQFTRHGIAGTSMAAIAEAAGVSRPALYQYFRDKHDIFASAFVALFEEHAEQALAALHEPGPVAEQLDGFLQHFEGDLWERLVASPHTDEIVEAKNEQISAAVHRVVDDLWAGMADHLAQRSPGRSRDAVARRADRLALLRLSPPGLRNDRPTVADYRRRLTALAVSVAAAIEAD